jgi:hypothetical protein
VLSRLLIFTALTFDRGRFFPAEIIGGLTLTSIISAIIQDDECDIREKVVTARATTTTFRNHMLSISFKDGVLRLYDHTLTAVHLKPLSANNIAFLPSSEAHSTSGKTAVFPLLASLQGGSAYTPTTSTVEVDHSKTG